ncbi:glutamate-cysteine ligase family protein, partial [Acidomonas methanolica]
MSNPGETNDHPIENMEQLVEVLSRGCKPESAWRIGTEHEKFGFVRPEAARGRTPFSPPPYSPDGIEAILRALLDDGSAWQAIEDRGALIGLKGRGAEAGRSISLEPAGQFELSGAPLATLHETAAEMAAHFAALRAPSEALGLG